MVVIGSAYKRQCANPRADGANVLEPHLESKSCSITSKTVRRIVCRREAELANKLFESHSEEGRGYRSEAGGSKEAEEKIIGIGWHQAEVMVDGGDWAEKRMWNAGQRDNKNFFLMLACLAPFYVEETARSHKLHIASSEVAFTVKGCSCRHV